MVNEFQIYRGAKNYPGSEVSKIRSKKQIKNEGQGPRAWIDGWTNGLGGKIQPTKKKR